MALSGGDFEKSRCKDWITVHSESVNSRNDVAKFLAADGPVAIGVVQREDPSQFIGDAASR